MKNKKLVDGIKYCTRCCFPETLDGITFDELGICTACRSSEEKMHINWKEREKNLGKILEKAKKISKSNYDCVLPISGGKDSFFQAHILTKKYNIPVYTPEKEFVEGSTNPVSEGDIISLPELDLEINILDVPGHTSGAIAYYTKKMLSLIHI